jgi:transcriptional regulator with XRE-family HTH domain
MKRAKPRNAAQLQYLRDHLRSLMEERELSPGELAAKAIVPLSSLLRILDGTIKNPGADVTLSLARALEVTVSELLGDIGTNTDYPTLYIEAPERPQLLHDITAVLAPHGLHISDSITTATGRVVRCVLHVAGGDEATLEKIEAEIRAIPNVSSFWIRDREGNIAHRTRVEPRA